MSRTDRPRILHLAYEDPDAPGSGGGAIRTREITSRLSGFDVEIATHSFPGARPRVSRGARWIHPGVGFGPKGLRVASYYAALPWLALAKDYDLLVEDFAPPWTFAFSPFFTRGPVVAVVQWLFANEMADKYGVPVGCLERLGMKLYRNFIVMAECMRETIRGRVPGSDICVAGCGVDERMFEAEPRDGGYAVFLGRLDNHQKGLDALLAAVPALAGDGFRLRVLGDGEDELALRRLATRLGVEDRVEFLGRVTGRAKIDQLAGCRYLCMPSRYETFGMVAAEAMACGKPVVATDLPCLRELVPRDAGILVPLEEPDTFRAALRKLWGDPDLCRRMGAAGRNSVRTLVWDRIAERQSAFYRHVLREHARRALAPHALAPDRRPAVHHGTHESQY